MILLQARTRLFVGVFWVVLILALLPCPVYASTQEAESLPLISSEVSASNITTSSATISWQTNGDATSQVFYDTASHNSIAEYAYHTTEDTTLVTEHSIPLIGLSSGRTYHYRVRSATVIDGSDFIAISEGYTFRTSSRTRTYYTETTLFGTETRFRISKTGEILKTIKATSEDGMLTITIPKGTIAKDKDGKRLKGLEAAVNESPTNPPEEASIIGLAYDFGPAGATFDPAITLTWSYDPDVLPEGVAEEDLVVAYYDEDTDEWVELACVVDTENNIITASVPHFTTFAVIGRVPAAPPEEEEVPTVVPPVEEEEERVVVVPPEPAAFSVSFLSVTPRLEVEPGEAVAITVLVANTGGKSGSYNVILKIDGIKEAEETVTIAAGEGEEVSFSVSREEADSYTVAVDGLSGTFTVVAPPEEEEEEVPIKPGVNWPVFGGVIGGLIVVGLLTYFLVFRRRASSPQITRKGD